MDYYGGTRLGDNRDADSIVALQASTGKRVWGFQLVHLHDLWDYDTPSGRCCSHSWKHPAVAVVTKTNMVYVFNELTGEPLYPITERAVPASTLIGEQSWPTQPFSSLPPLAPLSFTEADLHLHNPQDQSYCVNMMKGLDNRGLFTPPSKQGAVEYPGSVGGANWGSCVRSTLGHSLCACEQPAFHSEARLLGTAGACAVGEIGACLDTEYAGVGGGHPPPLKSQFHTPDGGGEMRDEDPQAGTPYRLARQALMTPGGIPCAPEPFGSIVAINLNTGEKVWSVAHGTMAKDETGSIGVGGVIATTGGLLLQLLRTTLICARTIRPAARSCGVETYQCLPMQRR